MCVTPCGCFGAPSRSHRCRVDTRAGRRRDDGHVRADSRCAAAALPVQEHDRLILSWREAPTAGSAFYPFGDVEIDSVARESRLLERAAGVTRNGVGRAVVSGALEADSQGTFSVRAFLVEPPPRESSFPDTHRGVSGKAKPCWMTGRRRASDQRSTRHAFVPFRHAAAADRRRRAETGPRHQILPGHSR